MSVQKSVIPVIPGISAAGCLDQQHQLYGAWIASGKKPCKGRNFGARHMVAVDRSMTIFVTERHTAYQYAVFRLTQFLFYNLGIFYKRGLWAGH